MSVAARKARALSCDQMVTERPAVMLSCRETMRLASERLDRRLPLRARIGFRMHVLMCSACRTVSRQIKAIDRLIRARFRGDVENGTPAPSPEAEASRERIRRAIHEHLGEHG